MDSRNDLPLSGIRVLDLTHRLAGPTLTMLLGDWGAEIVKLEWWYRMDAWRGVISIEHDVDGAQLYNKRLNWLKLNRNKRDITLNLRTEKGKELFFQLVAKCDVVADNFSAGTMDSMGLGYEQLSRVNSRIVMVSLPGFGNWGPHAGFVGNGGTIQGYAGLTSLTGYEDGVPRSSVNTWPDPSSGIAGAVAVAMALIWREKTGKGQFIDLAQSEVVLSLIGEAILDCSANGRVQGPAGNTDQAMAPHGCYPCKGEDSWVTIAVGTDVEWQAMCRVAGHPEWARDSRFLDQLLRHQNRRALDQFVEAWTRTEDRWELARRLQQAGVAATPVVAQEEFGDELALPAKGFFQSLDHPYLTTYPGPAARINGQELPLRLPPPMLGEHNELLYEALLGLSKEDLAKLRDEKVV